MGAADTVWRMICSQTLDADPDVMCRWMAPESYLDGHWDLRSDVWMFGVLLWELFNWADLPWGGVADGDVMRHIQNREKLGRSEQCPEAVYDVMLKCWKIDASTRITADMIEEAMAELCASMSLDALVWPSTGGRPLKQRESRTSSAAAAMQAFEQLEVRADSIKKIKRLGSGEFGEVLLCTLSAKGTSSRVAVKYVKEGSSESAVDKFRLEAQLLAGLRHGHIVEVKAVCFGQSPHFIALELMEGGDLQSYLETHADALRLARSVQQDLMGVLVQVAEAMEYLERKKIVHRDLAARNVLVGSAGLSLVKLSDLGMSRTLTTSYYRKTASYKVPAKWMAPESLFEQISTHASDVWSFGVLSWEVMSLGAEPYPDMSAEDAVRAVIGGYRMPRPVLCSSELFASVTVE